MAAVGLASTAATAGTRAPTGRIVGRIELCGALPGCRAGNGRVTVRDADGHRIVSERTTHSRFRFDLLPGHYTLVATVEGDHISRDVTATANKVTRANITFELK